MGAGASATSSKKLTPSFSRKESYLGPGGKKGYSRAYEHYHGGAPLLGPAEMRQKWGAYQHHGRKRALAGSHAFVLPEWKETQQCLGGGGGHKWSEMAFDFSSYDAYPAFARIPRQRFAAMIERLNTVLQDSYPYARSPGYIDAMKGILRQANAEFPFASFVLHVHKYKTNISEWTCMEHSLHVLQVIIRGAGEENGSPSRLGETPAPGGIQGPHRNSIQARADEESELEIATISLEPESDGILFMS